MVIRLKYKRDKRIKYIGHLDMMRLFERAIKRTRLPISHSQGFNPRPKIVFALPVAVGFETNSDYIDVTMDDEIKPEDVLTLLNKELPQGVSVIDAWIANSSQNVMKTVAYASYHIIISGSFDMNKLDKIIQGKNELPVVKKTKKGFKEIDIRELIDDIKLFSQDNEVRIELLVHAGSNKNLRPDLFMKALSKQYGEDIVANRIVRQDLFGLIDGEITSLRQF